MLEKERSAVHTVLGRVAPICSKVKITGIVALWHTLSEAVKVSGLSVFGGKRHMLFQTSNSLGKSSSGSTPSYNWTRSSKTSSFASFSLVQRGSSLHNWTQKKLLQRSVPWDPQDKKEQVNGLSEVIISRWCYRRSASSTLYLNIAQLWGVILEFFVAAIAFTIAPLLKEATIVLTIGAKNFLFFTISFATARSSFTSMFLFGFLTEFRKACAFSSDFLWWAVFWCRSK